MNRNSKHLCNEVQRFWIIIDVGLTCCQYNQSGQALLHALTLRQKGLVPATSGLSPLRDFHSIKFRPADIPVWLNDSHERLLQAPRPLRLRLRCQREKRCRSKSRHKGVISTLLGLYSSSMSAKPPLKSLQPQWLADEIRQQLLKAAGLYENADVISE